MTPQQGAVHDRPLDEPEVLPTRLEVAADGPDKVEEAEPVFDVRDLSVYYGAFRAVPDSLREAGFGVGATRWEVVRSHVLPYAAPGILTGTVLSLARALGEAAPLILVGAVTGRLAGGAGNLVDLTQLTERFTAMPIIITTWAGRPQAGFQDVLAPAAIVVLLVVVLLANSAAILLRNRYEKRR